MKLTVVVLLATVLLIVAFCRAYADDVISEVTTQGLIQEYNTTGSDYDDVIFTVNETSELDDLNGTETACGVCVPSQAWTCYDGGFFYVADIPGQEDIPGKIKKVIVYVGFSISLVACIVANIIYIIARRKLKHSPYHIHWNLIASFTLYHIVFLIDYTLLPTCYVTNVHVRNFLNILLAYTVLANFFWMLVEGLILFFIIVKSFFDRQEGKEFIKWCVLGWGTPALLVIIWIVVEKVTSSGDCAVTEFKVSRTTAGNLVCLVAPVLVILLINGFVLIIVIRNISTKLRADNHRDHKAHRRTAKSTFVLLILLGAYYVLPIVTGLIGNPCLLVYIVSFIGAIISSVQGLAVTTLYVFLNEEIKRILCRRYSEWRPVTMVTGTTPLSSFSSSKRNSSSTGSSEGSRHRVQHQLQVVPLELKPQVPAEDINSNPAEVGLPLVGDPVL